MEEPKQAEITIGTCGHTGSGKTTLLYTLTGKLTLSHTEELKRGITIRLGYANSEFRKCPKCEPPEAYTTSRICKRCGSPTQLLRIISFVDSPGHETLMATMLSGAALMDGALLLIAANEPIQPQTKEHLAALQIIGVNQIVIVQNKLDVVTKEEAMKNYEEIRKFISNTIAADSPIVPVCALQGVNVDLLIQEIEEHIKTPKRDENKKPLMLIARSFDVNKPGTNPLELRGGVIGGALKQGVLRVNDEIKIIPGIRSEESNEYTPLFTKIRNIHTGMGFVEVAKPGGNIGIETELDPYLTKADKLSGNVVCLAKDELPVYYELDLEFHKLERIVGTKEEMKVEPLKVNEILAINAWTMKSIGTIHSISGDRMRVALKIPVCILPGEKVAISRRIENRWRLIGYGVVL
ncbi:MAG: translation initiation factor IF-2 subunit gamma [Candidatus Nanoarchaeia archaeon]|nr:translation initiation factor IF-2 subunit gamma [Candidatus Haiyanarchaeum thermophilum]MCW1303026.1 translation initiation factor IF-2 subunit gamma [Candidatus Haiyanarchaeum thermophilum]MCW1303704.1 translation initiation factor IF-2 subunit gamma [Candidatus Haiyanarchaeum thermophilum]MCW1306384.1 translation initiation factor IF-2 subunit gamma [Candidatus Haiyanarchaeum thermophilum]MCW1307106.1 translation initiation factor IF-2 subunit gamma [Candidatus Haiyanarchaeum thermophilum